MAESFIDWFYDATITLFETVGNSIKLANRWFCLIVSLPVWIIPFLYWYFAIWKKGEEEDEREGSIERNC